MISQCEASEYTILYSKDKNGVGGGIGQGHAIVPIALLPFTLLEIWLDTSGFWLYNFTVTFALQALMYNHSNFKITIEAISPLSY